MGARKYTVPARWGTGGIWGGALKTVRHTAYELPPPTQGAGTLASVTLDRMSGMPVCLRRMLAWDQQWQLGVLGVMSHHRGADLEFLGPP